ncbi:hypothetical protein [Aquilutibacter rugosus]|uniref:hypothetical protein n=1 Tax=Aquilutibacter rugosus TaxID=3115820 RepID=UPI002F40E152
MSKKRINAANDIEKSEHIELKPPAILVMGPPRSGTSAISQMLSDMGVYFGEENDFVKMDHNPKFFELVELNALNDRLFKSIGHRYADFDYLPNPIADDLVESAGPSIVSDAEDLVTRLRHAAPGGAMIGLKDPRFVFTFPFWKHIFEKLSIPVKIVLTDRDLDASVESNQKVNAYGDLHNRRIVWLSQRVAASRVLDLKDPFIVDFDSLVDRPAEIATSLSKWLNIPTSVASSAVTGIKSNLRHELSDGSIKHRPFNITVVKQRAQQYTRLYETLEQSGVGKLIATLKATVAAKDNELEEFGAHGFLLGAPIEFEGTPLSNIVTLSDGSLQAERGDPAMVLSYRKSTKPLRLPKGWYRIDIQFDISDGKCIAPCIYPDYGDGYLESTKIALPDPDEMGRITAIAQFTATVRSLRFDPSVDSLTFTIPEIRFVRLSKNDSFDVLSLPDIQVTKINELARRIHSVQDEITNQIVVSREKVRTDVVQLIERSLGASEELELSHGAALQKLEKLLERLLDANTHTENSVREKVSSLLEHSTVQNENLLAGFQKAFTVGVEEARSRLVAQEEMLTLQLSKVGSELIRFSSELEKVSIKFESVSKDVGKQIDAIKSALGEKTEGFSQRIDEQITISKTINTRVDSVSKSLGERIEAESRNLEVRLEALSDTLDAQILGLSKKMEEKIIDSKNLGERIDAVSLNLGAQMGGVSKNLDAQVATSKNLGEQIDALSKNLSEQMYAANSDLRNSLETKNLENAAQIEELKSANTRIQIQLDRSNTSLLIMMDRMQSAVDRIEERVRKGFFNRFLRDTQDK